MPSATSAGPGQNPATPQPAPNSRLPSTSRRSSRVAVGNCMGAPSSDTRRLRAQKNAGAATAMAPAITSASDGSHGPARSRNPSTLAGLAMPDKISPSPKTRPATKDIKTSMVGLLTR